MLPRASRAQRARAGVRHATIWLCPLAGSDSPKLKADSVRHEPRSVVSRPGRPLANTNQPRKGPLRLRDHIASTRSPANGTRPGPTTATGMAVGTPLCSRGSIPADCAFQL